MPHADPPLILSSKPTITRSLTEVLHRLDMVELETLEVISTRSIPGVYLVNACPSAMLKDGKAPLVSPLGCGLRRQGRPGTSNSVRDFDIVPIFCCGTET